MAKKPQQTPIDQPVGNASLPAHLTEAEMHAWMSGLASFEDSAAVEQHLSVCDFCAMALDRLQTAPDSVLLKLRDAAKFGTNPTSLTTMGDSLVDAGEAPLIPTEKINERWQAEFLLAQGGIGEVWIARDLLLGRHVALKRLRPETAHLQTVQRRFIREAKITARLNHPGTAYMLDLVEAGPNSYYVMSLVEGQTLTDRISHHHLSRNAAGDPTASLFALLQALVSVSKTIAFAHKKQVLHRDLKSDNVVVGRYGQVTVIDWGLATFMPQESLAASDSDARRHAPEPFVLLPHEKAGNTNANQTLRNMRVTQAGTRLGTPSFMAPEQALGDLFSVGPLSDVYALGAILYEILTGRPPFVGSDVEQVLKAVLEEPPQPPREICPDISPELESLCLRTLSKKSQDRPQSAVAFAAELESWLAREGGRRQSEDARRQFFDMMTDLLVVHDLAPEVSWANAAWGVALGWSPEELVGRKLVDLVHPEDAHKMAEVMEPVSCGHAVSNLRLRVTAKDGRHLWFDWSWSPVPGENLVCAIGRQVDDRG